MTKLLADGLARCGRLGADALEVAASSNPVLSPGLLLNPLVARTSERVSHTGMVTLRRVLTADPAPAVRQEILAGITPELAVQVSQDVPLAALQQVLVPAALAGDHAAAIEVLRVGDPALREELVRSVAPGVDCTGGRPVRTWLAAATACPHLLSSLVDVVPLPLRAPVARFAALARDGGDPAAQFAAELIGCVQDGSHVDWAPVLYRADRMWSLAVHATGLPTLAAAALENSGHPRDLYPIVTHPHLAGTPEAARAQAGLDRWAGHDATVAGAPGRAALQVGMGKSAAAVWVGHGYDSAEQVALAWRTFRYREGGLPLARATVEQMHVAGQLACADRTGGGVWQPALTWLRAARPTAPGTGMHQQVLATLTAVAAGVHEGAGLGDVPLVGLQDAWRWMGEPMWLGRLVGEYLAGVPQVPSVRFVQVLLDLSKDFPGTLADLVASAAGISA